MNEKKVQKMTSEWPGCPDQVDFAMPDPGKAHLILSDQVAAADAEDESEAQVAADQELKMTVYMLLKFSRNWSRWRFTRWGLGARAFCENEIIDENSCM